MSVKDKIYRGIKYIFKGVPNVYVSAKIVTSSPNNTLEKRKIIVTGGSRGLGYDIAKKCVEEGADVLITGRNKESLMKAKRSLGEKCQYICWDIADVAHIDDFLETAAAKLGGIPDSLINNAGVSLHEGTFQDVTEESFDTQININLKGTYFLTNKFCKMLMDSDKKVNGNVIMMTSERGLYGDDIPYGLTKAAIVSYTKGMARRLINYGIRVNAIAPGVTASDMTGYKKDGNLYREQACGKRAFL